MDIPSRSSARRRSDAGPADLEFLLQHLIASKFTFYTPAQMEPEFHTDPLARPLKLAQKRGEPSMLRKNLRGASLAAASAALTAGVSMNSAAQQQDAPPAEDVELIEVIAKRVNARNRVDAPNPTLSYDEEYFQRFEPLSVGDMMKRVPGVVFASDIGEYSAPSLRGVGTEYTQILINGRRVTGGTNDNTVVVDRIPAELVERIEIIRSPSSDIDSQGIGGTLNIILKEGAELSGGVYRVGAFHIDGETVPSAFLSFGDAGERVEWGTSVNYQERFNRKLETDLEDAFDGAGSPEPAFTAITEGPDERESTDIAWTGDFRFRPREGHEWHIGGFYVDTDREELELGREFEAEDDDGELETGSIQFNQSDAFQEENWGAATAYEAAFGSGHSWDIELGYDATKFGSTETNWEDDLTFDFATIGIETVDDILPFLQQPNSEITSLFAAVPHGAAGLRQDALLSSFEITDAEDSEVRLKTSLDFALGGSELTFGVEVSDRTRDFSFRVFEVEDGTPEEDDAGLTLFTADERRLNGYLKWEKRFAEKFTLEVGARGEQTNLDLDATVSQALADAAPDLAGLGIIINGNQINTSNDTFELNPSAHFRWDVTDRALVRFSLARTVRRPSFDQLNPTLLIDDEESILGNPSLEQETAWGADTGFDIALDARDAILGFNVFYRKVSEKIELDGVPDAVNQVFQDSIDEDIEATVWVNNPNDGDLWGAELDVSYPLEFLGLPSMHVFANYTYLDSEILDANVNFPVEHRFSEQPEYVYNAGFDHRIEPWKFTWGASYQKRGLSQRWTNASADMKEVRDIEFEGNLEVFLEKTLFGRVVVRVAAQNLLDATKTETERAYESLDQVVNGTPVTVRTLVEAADPAYIVTLRGAF
jgi:outer membrane receptor protein involved in Fe transport